MAENAAYARKSYRMYALGLLTLTYTINFIDRQILSILQEPIKAELALSDSQLGLLTGFAFAVFYVTFGLPIARWADHGVRRSIIAYSVGLWSLMTGLCGFAQNFFHLLLARMGVGVGEAGGSPPAHSLISDIFPPAERATAISTYSVGINIGVLIGFLTGGWLNEFFGWRVAFFAVCVPGLIVALIVRFTLAEPQRGLSELANKNDEKAPPLSAVLRILSAKRTFVHLAIGSALIAMSNYAVLNWLPSFLIRSHGMGTGEIGTWLALIAGVCGGVGTFMGGYLADRFGQKNRRWYALVPCIAIAIGVPLNVGMLLVEDSTFALLLHIWPAAVGSIFVGPVIAVTHGMVSNRMRALASAIYFFVLNLIGLGLGPLLVGMLSDALHASHGIESLRYALLTLVPVVGAWSVFHFWRASLHINREWGPL